MEHTKIIKLIIDYIYSDEQLNEIFNHHNQKYTLTELLLPLTKILYNNISYRELKYYTHIHWCTHAFSVPMNEKINNKIKNFYLFFHVYNI